jgi:hypothetical protein
MRLLVALAVLGLTVSAASADESSANLHATLSGFNEVPPNLTDGTGSFSATVQGSSLTYTLTYSGLSAPVTQAHIHFAQPGVNGGIVIWLCQTATSPAPASIPAPPTCPQAGTVSRTVTAADVGSQAAIQGVAAGNFAGVLRLIQNGEGYANVHTTAHPGGEIRGQIRVGEGD